MTPVLAALLLTLTQSASVVPVVRDADAIEPQVAVGADGSVYVAFGKRDSVYCSASHDRGLTYAEPVKVADLGHLALGMRRGPRIAVAGKTIVISAVYGKEGKGRDGDLLAWRSPDGISWSGPVKVNDVDGSAREGLHAMAAGPNGRLACAWLDLRAKGTRIYQSVSTDSGQTWSRNALVYESPGGTVCQCCHPSVTYGSDGRLHVMWRNALDGARDMYTASSTDGKSFGPAQKLGAGTWPLDACPMDGGSLAVSPDGALATVWRRQNQIFACGPGGSEVELGPGEQPWAAAGPAGVYVVWLARRGGQVRLLNPGPNGRPAVLAPSGDDPVVAAGPNGPVIAAWTTPGSGISSAVVR